MPYLLQYINRFSRGIYRVQKELQENGNGKAIFDFSFYTAFSVVENVSKNTLKSTEGSIKYHLSQLIKKGTIKREGSDRTGTWIVTEY